MPLLLLFAATLFVSATLLFLVQPMIGKMLLPMLGGTPAVWNTCMVFFQALLLAGYAYAHATTAWLGVRRQALLHLGVLLLPFLTLSLTINRGFFRVQLKADSSEVFAGARVSRSVSSPLRKRSSQAGPSNASLVP